jgi:outer membrane protein assembly factor BamA
MKIRWLFYLYLVSFSNIRAQQVSPALSERINSENEPKNDSLSLPTDLPNVKPEIEPFPIISFDTDVGFGYGAKVFFLNQCGWHESTDLTVFNSTKGERWYRIVFSVPDFELRQGKLYSWAIDCAIDYDKYLKNSFFGIGNKSNFSDRECYTREPLEFNITLSRGFASDQVGQAGIKYKAVSNIILSDTSKLAFLLPTINSGRASLSSIFINYRYDTRNSYINPSHGIVFLSEIEYAPKLSFSNVSLLRLAGWIQHYNEIFFSKTILAIRVGVQTLIGSSIPIQMLLPIGGTSTLRGSPQDRFLDKTSIIMNTEMRFPIYWRFGGVIGFDAGKVWSGLEKIDSRNWAWNPLLGLRFYMDTFVVRADIGFGDETTGFYLNFGHLF